jgi:hypothetical protein
MKKDGYAKGKTSRLRSYFKWFLTLTMRKYCKLICVLFAKKEGMAKMFQNNNSLMFDIAHLTVEEKRKEITRFNPFHYIFGIELVSKPWLTYEEIYDIIY